jgi:hypothetical protein
MRPRLLACTMVMTLALPAAAGRAAQRPAPFAVAAGEVAVHLLSPAGLPVSGAVARLMITDGLVRGRAAEIHAVRPDSRGWVRFTFPDADPYVVAHPAQRRFNLEAVIDLPGVGGSRGVTAVDFVYDRVNRREATVVPVAGTTLTVPVGSPLLTTVPPTPALADPQACGEDLYEYECATVTYPSTMHAVPTVLAYNAGAGYDTQMSLTYDHAGRVQTSTARDFGAGIFEVEGAQSISDTDNSMFTFGGGGVLYGTTNEWAVVKSAWTVTPRYHCTNPSYPFGGSETCTEDGMSWAPYAVTGSASTTNPNPDNPRWHDRLCVFGACDPPDNACATTYDVDYTLGRGTERHRSYQAGLDVHGSIYGIGLHASATYAREETDGTTTVYKYVRTSPALKHALFVHTDLQYDDTAPGGGICPEVNIGDAWTTTSYTVARPNPADGNAPVDTISQTTSNPKPSQEYRKVGHCAYNPDECDPGSVSAT